MRTATVAALLAVTLAVAGLSALAPGASVAQFPAAPARAHTTLGPVQVLARPESDASPILLADAARARYGRVDALVEVRTKALPWSDAALVTGVAIRWD